MAGCRVDKSQDTFLTHSYPKNESSISLAGFHLGGGGGHSPPLAEASPPPGG